MIRKIFSFLCIALFLSSCVSQSYRGSDVGAIANDIPADLISDIYSIERKPSIEDVERINPRSSDFRVAMLLPMTGEAKKLGEQLRNAAQIALFDSPYDDNIILQFYDTSVHDRTAADAAKKALSDGAELIIGPVFASQVKAVDREVRGRVKIITFSSDPTVVGGGDIYSIAFSHSGQVRRIIEFALEQGYENFALLASDDFTGKLSIEVLEHTLKGYGLAPVRTALYNRNSNPSITRAVREVANYDERVALYAEALEDAIASEDETEVAELKKKKTLTSADDVDAVLIIESGTTLALIASMLPYYDVYPNKVKFLGTSIWNDSAAFKEKSLRGGWYTTSPVSGRKRFIASYKANYKGAPNDMAALAYDAVIFASEMASRGKSTSVFNNINGYLGISGLFRFLASGEAQRTFEVREIVSTTSARIISPAARDFMARE